MVKKIEIGLLLMLPLVVLGVVLLKPALVVQRVQVLPLSAVERREYIRNGYQSRCGSEAHAIAYPPPI